jgi:hypothetical protein
MRDGDEDALGEVRFRLPMCGGDGSEVWENQNGRQGKMKRKKKGVRREKFISVRNEVVPPSRLEFDSRPSENLSEA